MATVRAAVVRGVGERNVLVVQWRRLPRYVYRRLLRGGRHPALRAMLPEEAIGEGLLGLIRAAEVWDESLAPFPVFAFKVIARRMLGAPLTASVIRVPCTALPGGSECRGAALRALSCVSLEDVGGAETVVTSDGPAPGEEGGMSELPVAVAEALARLAPRERELLRLCYAEGKTQRAVARDWGVSAARVHQLLLRALARMRKELWTVEIDSPG